MDQKTRDIWDANIILHYIIFKMKTFQLAFQLYIKQFKIHMETYQALSLIEICLLSLDHKCAKMKF